MINFYKFIRLCGADPQNAVYPYVYYRQENYMNQEHEIVKRGSSGQEQLRRSGSSGQGLSSIYQSRNSEIPTPAAGGRAG